MWRNVLLGVASITVFFILAETALRLSGKVPTNAVRSPDLQTLDKIPGLFQPGLDFVDRIIPALPYRVRINSLGFRGEEFPAGHRQGLFRVLCLGDSYTFGPYVDDHATFPAVLYRLLKERPTGSGDVGEVINGGANGFTIADELMFLESKALALEPDLVILAFSPNDVGDLGRPQPQIELMRDHARLKSVVLLGPILELLQTTAVFNGMQRTAAWLRLRQRRVGETPTGAFPEALWDRYRSLLEELSSLLRRHGTRLLVVAWPSALQISGEDPMVYQERLELYTRELEIAYLDLAPAVREVETGGVNPFLLPHDSHPSAAGYEAAALAIVVELERLGYLSKGGAASAVPVAR